MNYCECGCGQLVARHFAPGHDARLRSRLLRTWRNLYEYQSARESAHNELSRRGWLPEQHGTGQVRIRERSRLRSAIETMIADRRNESDRSVNTYPPIVPPIDEATLPERPSRFERKFGIEIEAFGPTTDQVIVAMANVGLACSYVGYTHQHYPTWRLVNDSSIRASNPDTSTFELVSPILTGDDGFRQLRSACQALAAAGAQINRTCGLHVHLDAADLATVQQLRLAMANYQFVQTALDRILPVSRRSTSGHAYANPVSNQDLERLANRANYPISEAIGSEGGVETSYFGISRYRVINLRAFLRHGTVEYRQHSGTIEYEKISRWTRLMMALTDLASQRQNLTVSPVFDSGNLRVSELMDLLGMPGNDRTHWERREQQLAHPQRPRPVAQPIATGAIGPGSGVTPGTVQQWNHAAQTWEDIESNRAVPESGPIEHQAIQEAEHFITSNISTVAAHRSDAFWANEAHLYGESENNPARRARLDRLARLQEQQAATRFTRDEINDALAR